MRLVAGALGKSRLLIPAPCALPCFLVHPSLPASVFTSVKGVHAHGPSPSWASLGGTETTVVLGLVTVILGARRDASGGAFWATGRASRLAQGGFGRWKG